MKVKNLLMPVMMISSTYVGVEAKSIQVLQVGLNAPTKIEGQVLNFPVATLEVGGELNSKNEIKNFEINFQGEKVSVPLSEVANKTYDIKVQGVKLGEVHGYHMNRYGEGIVRLSAEKKFIGRGFPPYLDIQLKRVGAEKEWAIFHKGKLLKHSVFHANKNPFATNMVSLLLSPPKLTKMETTTIGCESHDLVLLMTRYQSKEVIQSVGCDLSKIDNETMTEIMANAMSGDNVYENAYLKKNNASAHEAEIPERINKMKEFGVDITKLDVDYFNDPKNRADIFETPIREGYLSVVQYLIELGFKPQSYSNYRDAMANVYQINAKKKKVVESPNGRALFELVKKYTTVKANAGDVLTAQIVFNSNKILKENKDKSLNYALLDKTIDLILDEGLDTRSKDQRYNTNDPTRIFEIAQDGFQAMLTKAQAQKLFSKLN